MSDTRYQRRPDIRLTALEGEGVVLHLGARRYFSVNETGLLLLEALKEPRTFPELVDKVLSEYEVTPEIAADTTREFLDQCVTAGVVERTG